MYLILWPPGEYPQELNSCPSFNLIRMRRSNDYLFDQDIHGKRTKSRGMCEWVSGSWINKCATGKCREFYLLFQRRRDDDRIKLHFYGHTTPSCLGPHRSDITPTPPTPLSSVLVWSLCGPVQKYISLTLCIPSWWFENFVATLNRPCKYRATKR